MRGIVTCSRYYNFLHVEKLLKNMINKDGAAPVLLEENSEVVN